MTDTADAPAEKKKGIKGLMVPVLAVLALGGGGFASTFMGFWQPSQLLSPAREKAQDAAPVSAFVNIPTIEITMPGGRGRSVVLAAAIETDMSQQDQILHLMPRVTDAFTTFLSGVDAAAYDKRGVLDIIRAELLSRSRRALGDEAVKDLLITEFRIK